MKIFKGISLLVVLGLILSFTSCVDEEKSSLSESALVKEIINNSRDTAKGYTDNRATITIDEMVLPIEGVPGFSGTVTLSGTYDDQTQLGNYNITIAAIFTNFKIKDVILNGSLTDEITIAETAEQTTITITSNGTIAISGDEVSGTITFNALQVQIVLDENGNEESFEILGGTVTINGEDVTAEVTSE